MVTTTFSRKCPQCGKVSIFSEDENKVERWRSGALIQEVWPRKSDIERETMVSGLCSDACYNKFLGMGEGIEDEVDEYPSLEDEVAEEERHYDLLERTMEERALDEDPLDDGL